MHVLRLLAAAALAVAALQPTYANDAAGYRTHARSGAKFANVRDDLKDAIVNRGFVIDYVGHFNTMLERTADVAGGSAKPVFRNAEYVQFCPAKLTHEAVAASPFAIANCPVAMFVFERVAEPGRIDVGYRLPVANTAPGMAEVNTRLVALLDDIAKEATK